MRQESSGQDTLLSSAGQDHPTGWMALLEAEFRRTATLLGPLFEAGRAARCRSGSSLRRS